MFNYLMSFNAMYAKLYKTDGTILDVVPANGTDFQLKELQEMVGGYIEIIPVSNGKIMVLDDEGKLKGKPINDVATMIFMRAGFYDTIVGDVLVCNDEMVQ
jgi:hypothetical protein